MRIKKADLIRARRNMMLEAERHRRSGNIDEARKYGEAVEGYDRWIKDISNNRGGRPRGAGSLKTR